MFVMWDGECDGWFKFLMREVFFEGKSSLCRRICLEIVLFNTFIFILSLQPLGAGEWFLV